MSDIIERYKKEEKSAAIAFSSTEEFRHSARFKRFVERSLRTMSDIRSDHLNSVLGVELTSLVKATNFELSFTRSDSVMAHLAVCTLYHILNTRLGGGQLTAFNFPKDVQEKLLETRMKPSSYWMDSMSREDAYKMAASVTDVHMIKVLYNMSAKLDKDLASDLPTMIPAGGILERAAYPADATPAEKDRLIADVQLMLQDALILFSDILLPKECGTPSEVNPAGAELLSSCINASIYAHLRTQLCLADDLNENNFFSRCLPYDIIETHLLETDMISRLLSALESRSSKEREKLDQAKDQAPLPGSVSYANELTEKLSEKASEAEALKEEIKKLRSEISSLKLAEGRKAEDAAKSGAMEIAKLSKKLAAEQEESERLRKQNSDLAEYIEILESSKSDTESDTAEDLASVSDADIKEEIKGKRIIFARDKESESYPIMRRLQELFPMSSFKHKVTYEDCASADMVVALTKYTTHNLYYTARDNAKANGAMFVHCDKSGIKSIVSILNSFMDQADNGERRPVRVSGF